MADNYRAKYVVYLEIVAMEHGVDPRMVDAIIHIESNWNPWAVRYETNWKYFDRATEHARALGLSLQTEMNCQKQSYGLGQIMGGTARSMGYKDHLTKLVIPEKNIELMVIILAKLKKKYTVMDDIASAYNAGFANKISPNYYVNQDYVEKFRAAYKGLENEWK